MRHINNFYILAFVVIFCILASCTFKSKTSTSARMGNLKSGREDRALDLNEELYKSFSSNDKGAGDMAAYPAYFGGSYTSSRDGLVVLIKDMDKKGVADIHQRIGSPLELYFKSCAHSLNELNACKEKLDKIYFGNPALRKKLHWLSTGMSIEKNRVVVFLANLSAKNLTAFKHQVSDSPMLIFEEMMVEE